MTTLYTSTRSTPKGQKDDTTKHPPLSSFHSADKNMSSVTIAASLYGHLVDPKEGAVASGWITKQGQNFKTWKRRFFTLHSTPLGAKLTYFTTEECIEEKGSLDLSVASGK